MGVNLLDRGVVVWSHENFVGKSRKILGDCSRFFVFFHLESLRKNALKA